MDIKDKIQIALLVTGLTAFGGGYYKGYVDGNSPVKDLEQKVEMLQNTKSMLKNENYDLQLDLIKRDNPYHWELFGDGYGSCGYRRPYTDSWNIEKEYIYLENK